LTEHSQREFAFGVVDVVFAVDDDLFLVLQDFRDDDGLIGDITSDAVGVQKVDGVEDGRFQVPPQLVERRSVEPRSAVSIIDVFFDENTTRLSDLVFEGDDLAVDRPSAPSSAHRSSRVHTVPPSSCPSIDSGTASRSRVDGGVGKRSGE
jgi:hypothetical protein